MVASKYIFENQHYRREVVRLRILERIHDRLTKRRISTVGLQHGWSCLEVGPGAGSIARWLSRRAGSRGRVAAVDLNPRFLKGLRRANVDVLQGDIGTYPLPSRTFDLVHARHVLIHTRNATTGLRRMFRALKSGGWLILEEPDFTMSRVLAGGASSCQAVNRVNRAICHMFEQRRLDPAFGNRLPSLVQGLGATDLFVHNDVPISPGGSPTALVMKLSAEHLTEPYLQTKAVTIGDIRRYCRFAMNTKTWAVYYGTVTVLARKP